MCTNLPILVNYNILGGWKYVHENSGHFFNVNDIHTGIEYILKNINSLTPRKHYIENFSKKISGKSFKNFIVTHFSKHIQQFDQDDQNNIIQSDYIKI